MNSTTLSMELLQDRLLKLEKQNRRFKQLGAAAFIGATALVVMGQAPSKKTIVANEFILKDSAGKIRAELSVSETTKTPVAQLVLFDPNGKEKVSVDSGPAGLGGGIVLSGDNGPNAFLTSKFFSISRDNNITGMTMAEDGLLVSDSQGSQTAIGVVSLVTPSTGETHKTSVASLVLFDKNKNVIWRAP
jgi:hypothetical protein